MKLKYTGKANEEILLRIWLSNKSGEKKPFLNLNKNSGPFKKRGGALKILYLRLPVIIEKDVLTRGGTGNILLNYASSFSP